MHNFHIPVMGLAFTIDSPLKVARYGINSVVSIGNDALLEDMRAHYSNIYQLPFEPISDKEDDYRARRITAYLNLLDQLVAQQLEAVREAPLDQPSDLTKYLDLLPASSPLKEYYQQYRRTTNARLKDELSQTIRREVKPGSIDVNIMTKPNKPNYDRHKQLLPPEYADALSALRGFANSTLKSSVVFSAGLNPRLYSYIKEFKDFFPDENGTIQKQVILKVSDYRSALIQGKFLAKKGIWISEFRIESGLNCGGHAFPTEGLLMGPILEEFKANREALRQELLGICQPVWEAEEITTPATTPPTRISVQGGIGTASEQQFLYDHYGVDSTGWGTPFLLVPEATTVDEGTLEKLMSATAKELYLSKTSPLGVPFNNLRQSASELKRQERIAKGRPGSPCLKKHLISNTEFTEQPICTASRQYQHRKIKELEQKQLDEDSYQKAFEDIVVKACLCEDLAASSYIKYGMQPKIEPAPAICPGPNLAYFSKKYSLKEMIDHIYGSASLLNEAQRPHMFIKELKMYIEYLEGEWDNFFSGVTRKKEQYLHQFKTNLESGIEYYSSIGNEIGKSFKHRLLLLAQRLEGVGA